MQCKERLAFSCNCEMCANASCFRQLHTFNCIRIGKVVAKALYLPRDAKQSPRRSA